MSLSRAEEKSIQSIQQLLNNTNTSNEVKDSKTPNGNPLVNHMNSFAGEDGYIDEKSIHDSLINQWHETEEQANQLAAATMQVAAFCEVPGVTGSLLKGGKGRFLAVDAVERF